MSIGPLQHSRGNATETSTKATRSYSICPSLYLYLYIVSDIPALNNMKLYIKRRSSENISEKVRVITFISWMIDQLWITWTFIWKAALQETLMRKWEIDQLWIIWTFIWNAALGLKHKWASEREREKHVEVRRTGERRGEKVNLQVETSLSFLQ